MHVRAAAACALTSAMRKAALRRRVADEIGVEMSGQIALLCGLKGLLKAVRRFLDKRDFARASEYVDDAIGVLSCRHGAGMP